MDHEDAEHLNLLSIFHYVVAGLAGLFACFPLLHLAFGVMMLSGVFPAKNPGEEKLLTIMGIFFVLFPVALIVLGLAFGALLALSGSYLKKRTHYTFCLVMAGVACIFMPFGTVLGVLTILVLMRPSVKKAFGVSPEAGREAEMQS